MPERRKLWSQMSPASPMTPKGSRGMIYEGAGAEGESNAADPFAENPQTFRRRVMPLTEAPVVEPNIMQQLSAMLAGKQ